MLTTKQTHKQNNGIKKKKHKHINMCTYVYLTVRLLKQ